MTGGKVTGYVGGNLSIETKQDEKKTMKRRIALPGCLSTIA